MFGNHLLESPFGITSTNNNCTTERLQLKVNLVFFLVQKGFTITEQFSTSALDIIIKSSLYFKYGTVTMLQDLVNDAVLHFPSYTPDGKGFSCERSVLISDDKLSIIQLQFRK